MSTLLLTVLAVAGNTSLFFFDKSLAVYGFATTIIIVVLIIVIDFAR